jgi:hypothetical protein
MGRHAKTKARTRIGRKDERLDAAVEMTFPASDPVALGKATATEPGRHPVDREAPAITTEQIEQAQRGEGHKHNS